MKYYLDVEGVRYVILAPLFLSGFCVDLVDKIWLVKFPIKSHRDLKDNDFYYFC